MYAPVVVRFQTYGMPVDSTAREYMKAVLALPAMREWFRMSAQEAEVMPQYELND